MSRARNIRIAATCGLVTATVAAVSAAVPASASRPSEVVHGKKTYPTVQAAHSAHSAGAASGSGRLHYGGGVDGIGVTTAKPAVYLVFWGTQWGNVSGTPSATPGQGDLTFGGDSAGMAPRVQELFKGIGTNGEQWSGVMTQYCEGVAAGTITCPSTAAHVAYPTGGAYAGVWYDNGAAAPTQATGRQIAAEAVNAAGHFGNTTAAANRNAQYMIVSAHGLHPDGFNTSSANWCAWHDYNGDTTLTGGAAPSPYGDVAFTNLPYLSDMGASCGKNYVNAGTAGNLDGVTIVTGHEYAETITDQNPAGGWIDNAGYENADKCAWNGTGGTGGAVNVNFGAAGNLAMQATYSNDVSACRNAHATVTGGNAVTVTNPGNQTTKTGTSVSLGIQATDSAAGQTLTYSASALPPGLSLDPSSGVISGTTSSTTTGTYPVTVTATDGTGASGSASFTWNVVSATSTCPTSTNVVGNPGFETGSAAPWSMTAGVLNNAAAQPPHGGSWNAWLDGYGATHTDTLSQSVSVPAGCTSSTWSFWLHIDSAETTSTTAYDKLTVAVTSGSTTSTLATYSNLNKASGYVLRSVNVGAFAGKTVTIKFTGTEDGSLQTSFVIDDVAVSPA